MLMRSRTWKALASEKQMPLGALDYHDDGTGRAFTERPRSCTLSRQVMPEGKEAHVQAFQRKLLVPTRQVERRRAQVEVIVKVSFIQDPHQLTPKYNTVILTCIYICT